MDWTKPISEDNRPPGAEVISLPGEDATVIGRVDATNRPCIYHPGNHHMQILRLPTTGLHLPGDRAPVAEMHWCPAKGKVNYFLDEALTPEEQGWDHDTVT